MSSEEFETVCGSFNSLLEKTKRSVEVRLPSLSGEELKRAVRDAEKTIEDAATMLREMEGIIQRAPNYERVEMRTSLADCKRQLDNLTHRVRRSKPSLGGFDEAEHFADVEAVQRAKLMQGTRALARASESVQRSRQIAAETDEIGVGIVNELDRQGETLERTRDRLTDIDRGVNRSRGILNEMAIRVVTNKIIMVVIIFLEAAGLAGVTYWKFFTKK